MAKLWLFLSLGLAQEITLDRLILHTNGTYEAHWKVPCPSYAPCEVRLPGRFTHCLPPSSVFAYTMEPDTLWGPFFNHAPLDAEIPLGLPVVAAYLAGSDIEEVKGLLHAQNPIYTIISTDQGLVWINRQHLVSLHFSRTEAGNAPYPATRLKLFPQSQTPDSILYLLTWGQLPDSLRFFYGIEPSEGDMYKLTVWVKVPPLFGQSYETTLEVQDQNNLSWNLGRLKIPAYTAFQVRLTQYVLRGRIGYLFSLPLRLPAEDSSWTTVSAESFLFFSSSDSPPGEKGLFPLLPAGLGYLSTIGQAAIPFLINSKKGQALRVPYSGLPPLQATLQESPRKSDRKSPLPIAGTLRVTNPFAEPIYLVVEKPVSGKPLPSEIGLARIEKQESSYLLSWEAVLAPGQNLSFSYAYIPSQTP
jgi:hypothetical protein